MEDEPFIRAIMAAPDDDLPRLVYADYLDETRRTDRAEFIRVQIELTRIPPGEHRERLTAREQNLIEKNRWHEPSGPLAVAIKWRRGFESKLSPCIRGVFGGETLLSTLANYPLVEEVSLGFCCGDAEFRHMPVLPNLRGFSFGGNTRLRDDSLPRIARWKTLRRLEIHSDRITDNGLRHLAPLGGLTALDLSYSRVTDECLQHLTALSALEELNLQRTQINGSGFGELASLPRLRRLTLRYTQIAGEGLGGLARCESLEELDLSEESPEDWYPDLADTLILSLLDLPRVRVLQLGCGHEETPGLLLEACRQVPTLREVHFNGERLL